MSMRLILEVEIINLWGIDFMGPFLPSHGKDYILLSRKSTETPLVAASESGLGFESKQSAFWFHGLHVQVGQGDPH